MKADQISEIIRIASIGSVLFPLVLYLLKVNQASRTLHLVGILTFVSAISDMAGYFLFARGQSTVVLFNAYYIITFLLLTWFYYDIYATRNGKMTILTGLVIYVLAFILVSFYVQSFVQYQTFMWTITGMTMIIYSISYFLYLFSTPSVMSNYGLLWINSGILLYFSLNLFMFVMSSYVLTRLDSEISLLIWSFHNVNNILKNVLLACGIYAFTRNTFDNSVA